MTSKIPLSLGKVVLNNFCAYRGETEIPLSLKPDQTITVIEGNMGVGKTTILNSIYWCLYGEMRGGEGRSSDEGIITNDVFEGMPVGKREETSVEIALYEGEELRYKIKRAIVFIKNRESDKTRNNAITGGSIPEGMTVEDAVEYSERPRRSDNWIPITNKDDAQARIENIFPKPLSSYFLFDAELLTNFFDSNVEKNVRNGIERISGLPIIDRAMKNLSKTSDEIRKGIMDVKLDPKEEALNHLVKTMEHAQGEVDRWEGERASVQKRKETLESFLRQYDEDQIKRLQADSDRHQKDLKDIKAKREKLEKEVASKLLYYNTMLRLHDSMVESMKMCNVWEKEGKIPIAVSGHALKNILAKDPPECICGASLEEGSPGRKRIQDHIAKNIVESPVIQNISTGRGHWGNMTDEVTGISGEILEMKATRTEFDRAYDAAKMGLKKISEQLVESESDEVRRASSELKDLNVSYEEMTGKIAIANNRYDDSKREHQAKVREYDIELKKHKKFTSHRNRLELAKKLGEIFKQCSADLIEEMRGKVERKTGEYFAKLVSRDDISSVVIKPNYDVLALGSNGKSKNLSAGQSCCLAMSYIAAIREIAQRDYFMLIDSPLHNISQKERIEIAQRLPQFLPEMQITMLMQDQELKGSVDDTSSVKATLTKSGSLWRHYILKSIKTKGDLAARTVLEEIK